MIEEFETLLPLVTGKEKKSKIKNHLNQFQVTKSKSKVTHATATTIRK